MSKRLVFWIGLVLSVVSLALILRGLDLTAVGKVLAQIDYAWLAVAVFFYFVVLWLKVTRWWLMFHPQPLRRGKALSALCIGYLFSAVMPARLGELVRTYVLGELEGVSKAFVLSTIVVEKILDVLTVLLLLVCLFPLMAFPAWVRTSGTTVGVLFLVLFGLVLVLTRQRKYLLSLLSSVLGCLPETTGRAILKHLDSAIRGLDILRKRDLAIKLWGLSLAAWLLNTPFVMALLFALHIPVSYTAAVFVLCVTSLGMTVPSAPGYLGTFHYLVVVSLALFGVGREPAMSFAIVLHLCTFLPISLLGVMFMWHKNYSLGKLSTAELH